MRGHTSWELLWLGARLPQPWGRLQSRVPERRPWVCVWASYPSPEQGQTVLQTGLLCGERTTTTTQRILHTESCASVWMFIICIELIFCIFLFCISEHEMHLSVLFSLWVMRYSVLVPACYLTAITSLAVSLVCEMKRASKHLCSEGSSCFYLPFLLSHAFLERKTKELNCL